MEKAKAKEKEAAWRKSFVELQAARRLREFDLFDAVLALVGNQANDGPLLIALWQEGLAELFQEALNTEINFNLIHGMTHKVEDVVKASFDAQSAIAAALIGLLEHLPPELPHREGCVMVFGHVLCSQASHD